MTPDQREVLSLLAGGWKMSLPLGIMNQGTSTYRCRVSVISELKKLKWVTEAYFKKSKVGVYGEVIITAAGRIALDTNQASSHG